MCLYEYIASRKMCQTASVRTLRKTVMIIQLASVLRKTVMIRQLASMSTLRETITIRHRHCETWKKACICKRD